MRDVSMKSGNIIQLAAKLILKTTPIVQGLLLLTENLLSNDYTAKYRERLRKLTNVDGEFILANDTYKLNDNFNLGCSDN